MIYLYIVLFSLWSVSACMASDKVVRIGTNNVDLILKVDGNGRLYQSYFGEKLLNSGDIDNLPIIAEAYITHGMEDYFEPAIRLTHNDGNPSLLLKYCDKQTLAMADGGECTTITLRDEKYPVEVKLNYTTYPDDDVITTNAVIVHREEKPIVITNYASSMLHLRANDYYLTDFSGDWAREVNMNESKLTFGKRVVDTKLGSRASMFCSPMFILSLDGRSAEQSGPTIMGTLAWTGNFRFTFEVDNRNQLRVISGINPYGSEYTLEANKEFVTPEFIFTYSPSGKGTASRNMHQWARHHRLKDGMGERLSLLNNWEATYFNFNEKELNNLFNEANKLGVDMFLLDDGWFGDKYPRNSDNAGLGDWCVNKNKLPNGIGELAKQTNAKGLKFGLWIEPEMVNPKSELYEKHKDWVIHLPNREQYYFRQQMVLDLSNPQVQDYVFSVVDNLLTSYPAIAYFKWDCNSPITNIYSPYLGDKQSHLYIEHVRGLYNILDRIKAKYPAVPMMLCSGGGGRSDYKALTYFTEFWPSDNTDAVERILIQWGYSHMFPAKSMAAHVTSWGRQPLKYRIDVASMCKLGFDIRVSGMTESEVALCKNAVANHKRLSPVILDGNLYRLVSPYDSDFASVMYVGGDIQKAVVYAFSLYPRSSEVAPVVKLQGLNPKANYRVEEINQILGAKPLLKEDKRTYSGDYLMKVGLNILSGSHTRSCVVELTME